MKQQHELQEEEAAGHLLAEVAQEAPRPLNSNSERTQVAIETLTARRRLGDQIGVFYMAVIVPIVLGWIAYGFWTGSAPKGWLLALGAIVVLSVIGAIFWSMSRTQSAGDSAAELDDPAVLGPLIEAYNFIEWDKRSAPKVRNRLIQHLGQVQPGELTTDQVSAMGRLLSRRHDDLRLSILSALRRVGNPRSIPPVRRLTKARNAEVRQAAAECIAAIETRTSQSSDTTALLRPAADSGVDSLLRAGMPTTNAVESELLRPTEGIH